MKVPISVKINNGLVYGRLTGRCERGISIIYLSFVALFIVLIVDLYVAVLVLSFVVMYHSRILSTIRNVSKMALSSLSL